jgi:hypothetical protein
MAKLDPLQRVGRADHRTGGKTGKTFGIPCRSVSKIAEADSTSVFPGFFPVLVERALWWVKFRPRSYPLRVSGDSQISAIKL